MKNSNIYAVYPIQIISLAVCLYHRFTLSFRDIKELLATRGIVVTYETIRLFLGCRVAKNTAISTAIRSKRIGGQLCDTWYLDEVFIKINGVLHTLWRSVDQDGDEIDILVQKLKGKKAAIRFFK